MIEEISQVPSKEPPSIFKHYRQYSQLVCADPVFRKNTTEIFPPEDVLGKTWFELYSVITSLANSIEDRGLLSDPGYKGITKGMELLAGFWFHRQELLGKKRIVSINKALKRDIEIVYSPFKEVIGKIKYSPEEDLFTRRAMGILIMETEEAEQIFSGDGKELPAGDVGRFKEGLTVAWKRWQALSSDS